VLNALPFHCTMFTNGVLQVGSGLPPMYSRLPITSMSFATSIMSSPVSTLDQVLPFHRAMR